MSETKSIWKIRNVKNYQGAHNHLSVGEVLEQSVPYVRVHCITYHFSKTVTTISDIKVGPKMVRIIPWNRIEVINVLPEDFDWANAALKMNADGAVVLDDGAQTSPITTSYEKSL